jgi:hypothetical protein
METNMFLNQRFDSFFFLESRGEFRSGAQRVEIFSWTKNVLV